MILQEADANTSRYLNSQMSGMDNADRDYHRLLVAMIIAKRNGDTSYDNVMKEYESLGGKFGSYYNSAKLKPYTQAGINSSMSSMPEAKNDKDAVKQSLNIAPDNTLSFLSRFDDGIKKDSSSPDKVAFVYQCHIGNRIPQRATNDDTWERQVFDTVSNYRMGTNDFCKVFSAYTLAFDYDEVNPNKLFLANDRFVEAAQAETRYSEMKNRYGKEDKIDWIKIDSSSETLQKIFDLCEIEQVTGGDTKDAVRGSLAASVRKWLYPSYRASNFKKNDYETPQLLVPSNYREIANRAGGKEKLRTILGDNETYKTYFKIQ